MLDTGWHSRLVYMLSVMGAAAASDLQGECSDKEMKHRSSSPAEHKVQKLTMTVDSSTIFNVVLVVRLF